MKKIVVIGLLCILIVESILLMTVGKAYYQAKGEKKTNVEAQKFKGEKASDENDLNILLIGSDSRGSDRGRSDSLMIVHYDQKKKVPKIISIMRDTYVDIPGYGKEKINAAYSYGGVELVRQTIKENFNIPIEYYCVVNFDNFKEIIDNLFPKGLKITAEKDMNLDGVTIKKGTQNMDGNTVLQYARFRHDEESDFGRIRRQQQVLKAVISQSQQLSSIVKLPQVVGQTLGYVSTNIPTKAIISCASDFLLKETKQVQTLSVPIANSWSFQDVPNVGSVLDVDLQKNGTAIRTFLTE